MLTEIDFPKDLPEIPKSTYQWTLPHEVPFLCWLAQKIEGNIAEIGCYRGETTLALAKTNPSKTIYAVDRLTGEDFPDIKTVCELARKERNVVLQLRDSAILDWSKTFSRVGMFFIDANHSYQGVASDTGKAIEYFGGKRSGLIVWHDYRNPEPWVGVTKFVDELAEEWNVWHVRMSMLAFAVCGATHENRPTMAIERWLES
jgi:Methyltransferase domain